jgi:hypothetical protein
VQQPATEHKQQQRRWLVVGGRSADLSLHCWRCWDAAPATLPTPTLRITSALLELFRAAGAPRTPRSSAFCITALLSTCAVGSTQTGGCSGWSPSMMTMLSVQGFFLLSWAVGLPETCLTYDLKLSFHCVWFLGCSRGIVAGCMVRESVSIQCSFI